MTEQDPLHPPTELVQELWDKLHKAPNSGASAVIAWTEAVAHAAQWGADQELEACVQTLKDQGWYNVADDLRAARRPKPPSPKLQALNAISLLLDGAGRSADNAKAAATIRRALEALPDD